MAITLTVNGQQHQVDVPAEMPPVPAGHWLGYATGVALAGWGLVVLAHGA
jgi:hypothetical protein